MSDNHRLHVNTCIVLWVLYFHQLIYFISRNLVTHGLEYGNCNLDGITTQTMRLWMFMFTLSKVIELGDTLFIVLRKSPLTFLHWYHHITVLVYCFYSLQNGYEIGFWFGGINFLIHTVMYSYYALKAMGYRLPSTLAQLITVLQILQMIVGTVLNVLSLQIKSEVFECEVPYGSAYSGLAMYITYVILFLNFFYQRYIRRKPRNTVWLHTMSLMIILFMELIDIIAKSPQDSLVPRLPELERNRRCLTLTLLFSFVHIQNLMLSTCSSSAKLASYSRPSL